jgi:hypothetical protein
LYAYIETGALNVANATTTQASEASIYGIGTTDPFFGTPNNSGLLTLTSTQNGSTGYGWLIQRVENYNGGNPETKTVLQLDDFDDSGDSMPADNEWQILKSYDLSSVASGWHRLSVEYDPATGNVTAKNDADKITVTEAGDYNNDGSVNDDDYVLWRKLNGGAGTLANDGIGGTVNTAQYDKWRAQFAHSRTPGLTGTFYVGYRENLGGALGTSRPPTFDMIGGPGAGSLANTVPEPAAMGLVAMGMFVGLVGGRRNKR